MVTLLTIRLYFAESCVMLLAFTFIQLPFTVVLS